MIEFVCSLLCTSQQLDDAKIIVTKFRNGEDLSHLTEDQIWEAKHVYDSAFHPETGEKMFLLGRMSAQVPMNMMITAAMITFYKTSRQVIFWQCFNQSFNAMVNYTNRSGTTPMSVDKLALSFFSATSGAVITALSLNRLARRAPPLIGRFVPFVAVAAANCINIPLMRQKEIKEGIEVYDSAGNKLGESKTAAKKAIREVVTSRIAMASPGMRKYSIVMNRYSLFQSLLRSTNDYLRWIFSKTVLPPILMNNLEKRGILKRYPFISLPLQTAMCGLLLVFATPMCCAIFPQKSSLAIEDLEPEVKDKAKDLSGLSYFNKGL